MNNIEGFYVGYFSGFTGNAVALFIFKDGMIVGADMGGATYDGSFRPTADGSHIEGVLIFNVAAGSTLITGTTSPGPARTEIPIKLPVTIANGEVQRIETPFGPINARFQKIRSLT